MPELKTDCCRSCGAPIVWARHVASSIAAPIDRAPSADGNVQITGDEYRIVPAAEREALAGQLHTNHFMRCPDRARFDRRRT